MNNQDRDLLELAAKAGEIEFAEDRLDSGLSVTGPDGRHTSYPKWNPLEDDGDALRLITKVGAQLRFVQLNPIDDLGSGRFGIELQWYPGGIRNRISTSLEIGADPNSLVRRAIVRAAAEIGRRMK